MNGIHMSKNGNLQRDLIVLLLYPCKITSQKSVTDQDGHLHYKYNTTMFTISEVMGSNLVVHAGDAIPDGESHVMTEIPQSAIEARDKMYTKNEYMPNSF